jgi:hypothetical protein
MNLLNIMSIDENSTDTGMTRLYERGAGYSA